MLEKLQLGSSDVIQRLLKIFENFKKNGTHFDNDARQVNFKDIDLVWTKLSNE